MCSTVRRRVPAILRTIPAVQVDGKLGGSEWLNDVHHHQSVIKSTDDLNRLITRFAALKDDLNQVRLSSQIEPHGLGFIVSMPKGNGIPVIFNIGNQQRVDDWCKRFGSTAGNDCFAKMLVESLVRTKIGRGTEKNFGNSKLV